MPLVRDAWTLGRFLAGLPLPVELPYATLIVIASPGIALAGGLRLIRRAVAPWQVNAGVTR